MLAMNIPLFITGFKYKGRHFIIKSLIGTVVLSVIADLTGPGLQNNIVHYMQRQDHRILQTSYYLH